MTDDQKRILEITRDAVVDRNSPEALASRIDFLEETLLSAQMAISSHASEIDELRELVKADRKEPQPARRG